MRYPTLKYFFLQIIFIFVISFNTLKVFSDDKSLVEFNFSELIRSLTLENEFSPLFSSVMSGEKYQGKNRIFLNRTNIENNLNVEVLGQGGFGIVLKVEGVYKGKSYIFAVKFFLKDKESQEICVWNSLNKLQEIKIPKLYANGTIKIKQLGEMEWAVMDYFNLPTLFQHIKENNIPIEQLNKILTEINLIINKLHLNNVTHGDIKTKNFLYDKISGKLILIDFGSSKIYDSKNLEYNKNVRNDLEQVLNIFGSHH